MTMNILRKKSLLTVSLLSIPVIFASCSKAQTTSPSGPVSAEPVIEQASLTPSQLADAVMTMWTGDYNNNAQIAAFREDGVPIWPKEKKEDKQGTTFGGFLPITSYYRTVDMPEFGDRVIYLEEFIFTDRPYRQRIYTVEHDDEAQTVRVKLWYFEDKTTYAGAWKDLSAIKDLKPEDMSPLPDNCDLYVTQTDTGRLHMKMPHNQCKFGSSIFDYQVSLAPDSFWSRDRIVDADTMTVKMTAGSFGYHKLDRVSQ